jgi:hypothetical protein
MLSIIIINVDMLIGTLLSYVLLFSDEESFFIRHHAPITFSRQFFEQAKLIMRGQSSKISLNISEYHENCSER